MDDFSKFLEDCLFLETSLWPINCMYLLACCELSTKNNVLRICLRIFFKVCVEYLERSLFQTFSKVSIIHKNN